MDSKVLVPSNKFRCKTSLLTAVRTKRGKLGIVKRPLFFYKRASNDIHNSCNCLPSFQWMEFSIQEMFDGRIAPLCCNYLTECLFVLRSSKFIQICQHKKGPCYFTQKNAPKTKDIVVQEEYSLVARLLACDPLGLLELIFYALWVLKPCDSCRIADGQ